MSDYTVSRKRKRHAVDPCLGFYLLSSGKVVSSPSSNISPNFSINALAACTEFQEDSDALVPSSIENNLKLGTEVTGSRDASHNQLELETPARRTQAKNLRLGSSENLNSSSNVASDPGQLMMTVEDFLKRSTKREAVEKKKHGNLKPKRLIKRLGDNGAFIDTEGQHEMLGSDAGDTSQGVMQLRSRKIRRAAMYEPSSDDSSSINNGESSPLEIKRKKIRGRKLKPLKERLYEAAVLTHGDPDDILVHGFTTGSELAPSRRPLRFVPNIQPELDAKQIDKHRPQTWSFVDPRKSKAIHTASFSSKIRPCLQHMNLAFTGKSANFSVQPPKRWKFDDSFSLGNLKSNRQPKISPVKKAYEYSPLNFVSLKEAEENYKSIFSSHKRNGHLPDVCTSTIPMVSVAESSSYVEGRVSDSTNNLHMIPLEKVILNPNLAMEASPQVAVDQIRNCDNLNDLPSASLYSSPIINSLSSPTALALPVTPKSTQDRPIPIAPARHGSLRADIRESASRTGSDVTSKPMRPLASFFDQFIQNIRNVAVSQDKPSLSDRHQVSKRPLRKSSRNEHSPRYFDSQRPWNNIELEYIPQNDPANYKDHMNGQRKPDLPYNHRLSPDILTLLEPQNYQVILSSPS